MNNASSHPFKSINLSDKFIVWTLLASLLAHAVAALVIPNMSFDDEKKKPEPIKVELVKKPEPVAIPEPVIPPPPKPKPKPKKKKVKPKKIKKPKPLPVPKPIPQEIIPEPVIEPPVDLPPEPEVIAVEPVPEAPPPPVVVPVVAPPPPPVQPPKPSQAEVTDARSAYGSALWGAIKKHKKYPRIAKTRGWQGKVILELSLDGQGKLLSKKVIQSSGHAALDKQALKMVEKAAPFPVPPKALRDGNFTIKVPVPFKLVTQ